MIAILSLIATALAVTPGGFRMSSAQPLDVAGARSVLIVNPKDEVIFQATPRFSTVLGKYGLDAEISGLIQNGRGGYLFAGLGSLRTGHWYVHEGSAGRSYHRFGGEILFPVAPATTRVQAWGSSIQDTLTTVMVQAGWLGSWNKDMPFEVRLLVGYVDNPFSYSSLVIDHGVAKVIPFSDVVSLVIEQDFVYPDLSPANLRPMVRFDIDRSTLDTGLQVPWGSWVANGGGPSSVQLITQYRGQF